MCSFRDGWNDLAKLNAKLYGISGDYVFTHHEWAKTHRLTIPLLQDHDHAVANEATRPALEVIERGSVQIRTSKRESELKRKLEIYYLRGRRHDT